MDKFCKSKDFEDLEKLLVTHIDEYHIPINEVFCFKKNNFSTKYLVPRNNKVRKKITKQLSLPVEIYKTNYIEELKTKNENIIVHKDISVDIKWFIKQNNYINNGLNLEEQFTLYGYTLEKGYDVIKAFHNDGFQKAKELYLDIVINNKNIYLEQRIYFPFYFGLVNSIKELEFKYLTNDTTMYSIISKLKKIIYNKDNEYIYKEIIKYIDKFITDFIIKFIISFTVNTIDSCIKNAPFTNQDMWVYRGTKDKYIIDENNELLIYNKKLDTYNTDLSNINVIHPSIMSTSISMYSTEEFMNISRNYKESAGCCLKVIKVPKGSRVLFLSPISNYINEVEILFASNSKFKIKYLNKEMKYISTTTMSSGEYIENLCIPSPKLLVSETEFIGYL